MPVLETLVTALEPWSSLYGDSTVLSVGLTFAHLGAMMIGGGLAIGADRMVLRAGSVSDPVARRALADAVGDVHRPVVVALLISLVSGLLQLTADLEALAANRILWLKIGLLVALAVNGLLMLRDENALRANPAGTNGLVAALRLRAMVSLVLWLAIVLAGVSLMQG
jgi:hypothetical protein